MSEALFVIVCGLAGSGKSEVGRRLARELDASVLDKDTLSRGFVEALLEKLGQTPDDRESAAYLQSVRPLEYAQLERAALENLDCGNSVIVTAPFVSEMADPEWYETMADRADARGARVEIVWVRCDPSSMQRYLADRGAARDRWKRLHWEEYLATVAWDHPPKCPHHTIDNSVATEARAPVAQIAQLVEHLR